MGSGISSSAIGDVFLLFQLPVGFFAYDEGLFFQEETGLVAPDSATIPCLSYDGLFACADVRLLLY